MAVNYHPDRPRFVPDTVSIRRRAVDERSRRRALAACLDRHWADLDVGCIERVENSRRWGWVMYPHRAAAGGVIRSTRRG